MTCAGPSRPILTAVRRFCLGCRTSHLPIRPYSTEVGVSTATATPVVLPKSQASPKTFSSRVRKGAPAPLSSSAEIVDTPECTPKSKILASMKNKDEPRDDDRKTRPGYISPGELKKILPLMTDLGISNGEHVTVAMSGGVDSSVALRILKDFPIKINVIFMRNWDAQLSESEPEKKSTEVSPPSSKSKPDKQGSSPAAGIVDLAYTAGASAGKGKSACEWEKDWEDVKRVCKFVGIPDHSVKMVDFSKEYWTKVFEPCVGVWESGGTPNPDVLCNSQIKFGALLDYVSKTHKARGIRHFLATGHYARADHKRNLLKHRIFRAKDRTKDQSYYLSGLAVDQVERTILPLGNITKAWTRRLARHWELPTAEREESMGVCFIGERDNFGDFITQYTTPSPEPPGNLVTPSGEILGPHNGYWHYTIGQRARLPSQEERWFIARKGVGESGKDILVVPGADHPALMCWQMDVPSFSWVNAVKTKGVLASHVMRAQIRHRMEDVQVRVQVKEDGEGLICEPIEPLGSVSPGQVLAIYRNTECMGSGVIASTRCLDELDETRVRNGKIGSLKSIAAKAKARRKGDPDWRYGGVEGAAKELKEVELSAVPRDLRTD